MDITTLTTTVTDPRDRKKYIVIDAPRRRVLENVARALFRLVMKMEVQGLENLPLQGPVVLAANHVNDLDMFPIQFALPLPIFFMGRAELFGNPLMDIILRNLGSFPINRGERDPWAMRHAAKVLNQGQTLGMFPERARSKGRGLAVAKTGTARLAIEADCPILPVTVAGSEGLFKSFPHRARVRIVILPPLHPQPGENPLALTDRMMFTLARALPLQMRGVYAEMPRGFQVNT